MVTLAGTRLSMYTKPQQTAEMNPSYSSGSTTIQLPKRCLSSQRTARTFGHRGPLLTKLGALGFGTGLRLNE